MQDRKECGEVYALQLSELTRKFGFFTAVDHITLEIPAGCIFGFLGANGAGKSTTIKLLTGLMRPTSGTAQIAGYDVIRQPLEVKRRIGVVPEGFNLYERLTANEYMELVGRLYGLPIGEISKRRKDLLEALDLADKADVMSVDFSTGMKKKLALAGALIHTPKVLFLDEPFEGVDVISCRTIKDLLQMMAHQSQVTIFLSTHILELVERLCDRVAIIHQGRLVAHDNLNALRRPDQNGPSASLEEVFLNLVRPQPNAAQLEWLVRGV